MGLGALLFVLWSSGRLLFFHRSSMAATRERVLQHERNELKTLTRTRCRCSGYAVVICITARAAIYTHNNAMKTVLLVARSAVKLSFRSANHEVAGQSSKLGCSCPIIDDLTQSDPRDEEMSFPSLFILSGRASSSGSDDIA